MPPQLITIQRKDAKGTIRIRNTGWSVEIHFLGARGKREHTINLTHGDPVKVFAMTVRHAAEILPSQREAFMQLVKNIYWNIGDRVSMYIDNHEELTAALMAASEWKKHSGYN